jgi:DNA-binding transcriptional LysR family regulator
VKETNSLQVINNVIDGPFNIGIIRYQIEYENYFFDYLTEKQLRYEPIWEYELLVLMSEQHPLAQNEKIHAKELDDYTEISHGDNTVPYLMQGGSVKVNGSANKSKNIYIYERCSQYDLLGEIPTTYMWVTPIPEKWLERYHLVQRKCKASGNRLKDVFFYPKDYKFSELDRKFIDKLYASKNEVAFKEYF